MKALKRLSVVLLSLLVSAAFVHADTTVVGTGNPAKDVAAVQAAVDAGGTVTLVGLFDFGEDRMGYFYPGPVAETPAARLYPGYDPFSRGKSTVFITRSVSIRGEGATILGGRPAFWIGWDGDILEAAPASGDYGRDWIPLASGTDPYDSNFFGNPDYAGPGTYRYFRAYRDIEVTIDGIESRGARTFFIMAGAGRDLVFTRNGVYDCTQADFMVWPFGSGIASWNVALNAAGLLYPPNYFVQNIKTLRDAITKTEFLNAITGDLLIRDNTVVNQPSPGGGIASAWTNAAVTIEGNAVTNAARDGIHLSDNPGNAYLIKNNTISAVTNGINIFDTLFPVKADVSGNVVHAAGPLRIKGNEGSVIRDNRLFSNGLPQMEVLNSRDLDVAGIASLPGSSSDRGILLSGTSSSNAFAGIDFSQLTVTRAYVSCETGTNRNTGVSILVPTCDPGLCLADLGQENQFEFLSVACLIDKVESSGLPAGVANSLLAKLRTATDSLGRSSPGSAAAAIGALGAFINECRGQKGKKIPAAQADDLIAYARRIRAVLSNSLY